MLLGVNGLLFVVYCVAVAVCCLLFVVCRLSLCVVRCLLSVVCKLLLCF